MKTQFKRLTLLVLVSSILNTNLSTFAQGPAFTYQGRVKANGVDFNGAGQFKFAFVTGSNANQTATVMANVNSGFVTSYTITFGGNGYISPPVVTIFGGGGSGATATTSISGGAVTAITAANPGSGYTSAPTVTVAAPPENISYTTYWSNDGTSGAGGEPSGAVSVGVSNGLFTVVLGDTTLPNMTALDASLFAQPNLQLRIWFNDGVHGFAALDPAQNLTPTPYAITARALSGSLSASQLSTGSLADARLSANVALRTGGNTFSGSQFVLDGSFGIGTASPQRALQVGDSGVAGSEGMIHLGSRSPGGASLRDWELGVPQTGDDANGEGYSFVIRDTTAGPGSGTRLVIKWGTGNVGIGTTFVPAKLNVTSTYPGDAIRATSYGGIALVLYGGDSLLNLVEGYIRYNVGTRRVFHIDSFGTYVAGSDFAEALPACGEKSGYEAGDVLVASETAPGKVEKACRPNDPRLVGVYSTRPGMLGADKNGETRVDADDLPVAVVGIVPTKVSTENGPIRVGDPLTTSATPGYAMKASAERVGRVEIYQTGTILGKALEPLGDGKGVIKVLVTLR